MSKYMDCTRIQEVLPWYVNDTAAAEQRMEVKVHLQQCDDCAAEAEWLLVMKTEMPGLAEENNEESSTDHADVEHAFEQLMGRIDNRRRKQERWQLLAAASVLLAVATLLGSLFTSYLLEPRFQTVTDVTSPAQGLIRIEVRFAPEAQLTSLRNVMEQTAAEVRKGPDADGWIVLEVPLRGEQVPGDVLAAMRADTQVLEVRLSTDDVLRDDEVER